MPEATATAHPNIALVKYWGKRDLDLNLPAVPSLSLTLERLHSRTTVRWGAPRDRVVLDGDEVGGRAAARVLRFLDLVDPDRPPVEVRSANSFPTAAGLASSASAFAALAVAATAAAEQDRTPEELSVLARRGSGSACRSLWGGFVEWRLGERPDGTDSHGLPLDVDGWDVALVVAVVSGARKNLSSTEAMERARRTSPYYAAWVAGAQADVDTARAAIHARDLPALGQVMERSTLKMHATLHTAVPWHSYWKPATLAVVREVRALRDRGVWAWLTMDAGPNVKILCSRGNAEAVRAAVAPHVARTEVLGPGPAASLS